LCDKRLLFVTGKGGVGKTTVAIALGIAASRRGSRTIVAELSGQDRAATAFGGSGAPAPGSEVELADGLFAISIDVQTAMEEYLHERAGLIGDRLASLGAFQAFAAATPGMRELLAVGKVWELAQDERRVPDTLPYDLVIVDAPASGHGLGALRAPRTFAEIARVGPIAHQGRTIDATLRDPAQTGVVAVVLPEEMPVTETLALHAALRDEMGIELAALVANAVIPYRLGPRQARTVADALARVDRSTADDAALAGRRPTGTARANATPPPASAVRAALHAALSEHARAATQHEQLTRLAEGSGREPHRLPYVIAPVVDRAALEALATELEPLL
jgi:anion-transporting  ArsA/GET3 family ATPase